MRSVIAWSWIAILSFTASAQTPVKRVLIMDDGSLLEGSVDSFDGVVRITSSNGKVHLTTAKQVIFIGETRESAYDFAAAKVDSKTADGARQLAEWCEKVGFHDKALVHWRVSAALEPNDRIARAAITRLEKTAGSKPVVSATSTVNPTVTPAMIELAGGAGVSFATQIQPILTNQCARCHAADDHAGKWKLSRVAPGYANPEATAANLKAVSALLNREKPADSPLLLYSLLAHGGQQRAAFAHRDLPAYQKLEVWVLSALPKSATATASGFGPMATLPARQDVPATPTVLPGAVVGTLGRSVAVPIRTARPGSGTEQKPAPVEKPAAVPNPADPFDPATFNRLPPSRSK